MSRGGFIETRRRFDAKELARILDEARSGRLTLGVGELCDLIREVNPTAMGLGPTMERARYEAKSALQSLLVRRHRDQVRVGVDPDTPGVVSLGLRSDARGACHAPIDALDEDVRGWVQRQVDTADTEDAGASGRPGGASIVPKRRPSGTRPVAAAVHVDAARSALRAGEEALEAFDYEEARARFAVAFDTSGGAVVAARPLLSLLVETYADDEAACALEARIDAAALADPVVRGLVGLASARLGREATALRLVADLRGPVAAEAYAALARRALDGNRLDETERFALRAREAGPVPTEVLRIEADLARRRSDACAPLVAALKVAVEKDEPVEIERCARALLARQAESAEARRALRKLDERRRHAEAEALLRRAEIASGEGRHADAVAALSMVRDTKIEAPDLELRLATARRLRDAAERVARVEGVVNALRARLDAASLGRFIELGDAERAEVRAAFASEPLDWVEGAGSARKRPAQLAEAIVALMRARQAASERRHEQVLELLTPHAALLAANHVAASLGAAARGAIEAEWLAAATERVDAAQAAVDAREWQTARIALGAVHAAHLDATQRERAAILRAAVDRAECADSARDRFRRLWDGDDLFGARALAEAWRARTEGTEQAAWALRSGEASAQIHDDVRWCVRSVAPGRGAMDLRQALLGPRYSGVGRLIRAGGTTLVVPRQFGAWLALCEIDIPSGHLVRAGLMRLEGSSAGSSSVSIGGNSLWFLNDEETTSPGGATAIDVSTWELNGALNADRALSPGGGVENAFVTPDGSHVWVSLLEPDVCVGLATDGSPKTNRFKGIITTKPVLGSNEVSVATMGRDGRVVLRTARGTEVRSTFLGHRMVGTDIALRPAGDGCVILGEQEGGWDSPEAELKWFDLRPDRRLDGPHAFAGQPMMYSREIAAARSERCTFVLLSRGRPMLSRLVALGADGDRTVQTWTTPVPPSAYLLTDPDANVVLLATEGLGGMCYVPLRRGAPPSVRPIVDAWLAPFLRISTCLPDGLDLSEDDISGRGEDRPVTGLGPRGLDEDELRDALDRVLGRPVPRADDLLKVAADAMRHGDFQIALEAMTAPRADWTRAKSQRHRHHSLGLALLHNARAGEASAAFREAAVHEDGSCDLAGLIELADAVAREDWSAEDLPLGSGSADTLVRSVRIADKAFAARDPTTALRALDIAAVHASGEVQTSSRLAQAWLDVDDDLAQRDPVTWYRKSLALARAASLPADFASSITPHLPLGTDAWDSARVIEVAGRATAWLTRQRDRWGAVESD